MDKPFPAYRGTDPYVFVCYAHKDDRIAYREMAWLHDQGVRLWYDEGISAGRVWRGEIADALDHASALLFFISRAALDSHHCQREVHYALDRKIPVYPIYIEDVSLPSDLALGLNLVQALKLSQNSFRKNLLAGLEEVRTDHREPEKSRRSLLEETGKRRNLYTTLGLGLVLVTTLLATLVWFTRQPEITQSGKPVVSIEPLSILSGNSGEISVPDVSRQIWNKLASNQTLRLLPYDSTASMKGEFQLVGDVIANEENLQISIHLLGQSRNETLLSRRYNEPSLSTEVIERVSEDLDALLTHYLFAYRSMPNAHPAATAFRRRAYGLQNENRLDAAIPLLEQALRYHEDLEIKQQLADVLYLAAETSQISPKLGFTRSHQLIKEIIAEEPDNSEALQILGKLHFGAWLDFPLAFKTLERSAAAGDHSADNAIQRGAILLFGGETAAAVHFFRHADTRWPNHSSVKELFGRALLAHGLTVEGWQALDLAMNLGTQSSHHVLQAAVNAWQLGDADRLIQIKRHVADPKLLPIWIDAAIKLLEGDPKPLATLAREYEAQTDYVQSSAMSSIYAFLKDWPAHIRWLATRELDLEALHIVPLEIYFQNRYNNYWQQIDQWGAESPENAALLAEHKARIARISRNMDVSEIAARILNASEPSQVTPRTPQDS